MRLDLWYRLICKSYTHIISSMLKPPVRYSALADIGDEEMSRLG